jgi:hypothetical protein
MNAQKIHRRIKMNSQINIKGTARRLALISAVLLLHSNTLLAAEFAGDPQSQARALLSGTVGDRSTTTDKSIAVATDGHATPIVDAQEQARRMILGAPTRGANDRIILAGTSEELRAQSEAGHRRTYADPQESAQRMILGAGAAPAPRGSVSLFKSAGDQAAESERALRRMT